MESDRMTSSTTVKQSSSTAAADLFSNPAVLESIDRIVAELRAA